MEGKKVTRQFKGRKIFCTEVNSIKKSEKREKESEWGG